VAFKYKPQIPFCSHALLPQSCTSFSPPIFRISFWLFFFAGLLGQKAPLRIASLVLLLFSPLRSLHHCQGIHTSISAFVFVVILDRLLLHPILRPRAVAKKTKGATRNPTTLLCALCCSIVANRNIIIIEPFQHLESHRYRKTSTAHAIAQAASLGTLAIISNKTHL